MTTSLILFWPKEGSWSLLSSLMVVSSWSDNGNAAYCCELPLLSSVSSFFLLEEKMEPNGLNDDPVDSCFCSSGSFVLNNEFSKSGEIGGEVVDVVFPPVVFELFVVLVSIAVSSSLRRRLILV